MYSRNVERELTQGRISQLCREDQINCAWLYRFNQEQRLKDHVTDAYW